MKPLVAILVVLNLLTAAWIAQGATDRLNASGQGLPAPEMSPERIRVLGPEGTIQRQRDSGSTSPPPPVAADPAPRAEQIVPARDTALNRQCLEWTGLRATDSARAMRSLEELKLAGAAIDSRVENGSTWWVFIPPAPSRRQAEARVADLKRLRVEEYYVISDDQRFNNAISLGVFSTEAGALSRRESLLKLGVRDANVAPRVPNDPRVLVRVAGLVEQDATRVREFARTYAGTETRNCGTDQARGG